MMDEFVTKVPIWHTADNKYYESGTIVKLTHLSKDEITQLIASGVVEPLQKVEKHTKKGEDR